MGYYLRARFTFAQNKKEEERKIRKILSRHFEHIQSSPWMGLPELTNSNGSTCHDSCGHQAWSVSSLLDVLYDLNSSKAN